MIPAVPRGRLLQMMAAVSTAVALGIVRVQATPAVRKTLVVCDDVRDPTTLDPQKEFSEKNLTLVQQIYEGLIRFAPDGRIEPALATSWERLDPLRTRFHLRRDVRFHNGETFDAESVRFSIKRYLDPRTGFPARGFINSIQDVQVIDDHTVDIITKFPDGLLLKRLAGFVLIVPPGYLKDHGDAALSAHPIGTGAFKFQSWEHGKKIVLVANKDYWQKGFPKIDTLVFRFIPQDKQFAEFAAGKIDILTELPGTKTYAVQSSKAFRVVKAPTLYTVTASLNISSGPLRDARVRRALNYGIDRRELIRYDLLGNGRPIDSLIFPTYPAEYQGTKLSSYDYDHARAEGLLEAAGDKNGLTLRMLEVKSSRAARIIADQWRRLGIRTEIVSTTDAQMRQELAKGGWDIFLSGCPDPMYDPYFIHYIFLSSQSPYSLSANPTIDGDMDAIVHELDDRKRAERTKDLARYVNAEALTLFTYQRIKTYGVRKNVVFRPYESGMPYYRDADIRPVQAHVRPRGMN